MEIIKAYFKDRGKIYKHSETSVQYRVRSHEDIAVIIDHFDKYPLLTQKRADYLLFKSIVELCNQKEHLTQDGLKKVVSLRAAMNTGLSEKQKAAFPDVVPVGRPIVKNQVIKDPN